MSTPTLKLYKKKLVMTNNYFWHEGSYYNQIKGVAMGAKYAPSVANLPLSQWEEQTIHNENLPEITLYKQYIEDIVILWNGAMENLSKFLANINVNSYGLKFTGTWDMHQLSV